MIGIINNLIWMFAGGVVVVLVPKAGAWVKSALTAARDAAKKLLPAKK